MFDSCMSAMFSGKWTYGMCNKHFESIACNTKSSIGSLENCKTGEKANNSVKNQSTRTRLQLVMLLLMTDSQTTYKRNICIHVGKKVQKFTILGKFPSFKVHNSVKNQWAITKLKLDL